MNPTFTKLLVPFLLVSFVSADETQEPKSAERYELIYQFRPGQKLRYVTVQQATTDAAAAENHKIDKTEAEQRRVFTVDSVDGNSIAHVSMQFEYVRMQMQTDDRAPIVFDTTMKESEIPSRSCPTTKNVEPRRGRIKSTGSGDEPSAWWTDSGMVSKAPFTTSEASGGTGSRSKNCRTTRSTRCSGRC